MLRNMESSCLLVSMIGSVSNATCIEKGFKPRRFRQPNQVDGVGRYSIVWERNEKP